MISTVDIFKAFATAIVILVVNVAISFVAVAIYAYLIEPGHDQAFYEAAAQEIAPWSSVFAGAILFFGAAFFLGKRRPDRNAVRFAFAIWLSYAVIDIAILASEQMLGALALIIGLSLSTKLAGALLGGRMARGSG